MPSATYLSRRKQKLVFGDKSSKVPSSCLRVNLSVNSVNLKIFSYFTFHFLLWLSYRSRLIMNPGFRNNFPGFWDIHSDQMMNPNEAQDRYRPGQLFLRQQIPQNTFPPATAVLAPFQPLQPAQAGCSGTAPLPLAPMSPETPEPQEACESGNSGKAGRGYEKWGEEEEKLLVQLWCDKHTRLESRHAR